jgi:hypothetical protein
MRRLHVAAGGVLLVVLAAFGAFRILASHLEHEASARIEAEAARLGLRARAERVRVAFVPPLRVSGLTVEKPGEWQARLDEASVSLRPWGPPSWGWVSDVSLGAGTLTLPAGLAIELHPSAWKALPGPSLELRAPTDGLVIRTSDGNHGRVVDVEVSQLQTGMLGRLVIEGQAAPELGVVDGEIHGERGANGELEGRWRLAATSADTRGKVSVTGGPADRRLGMDLEIERLDFARLFAALGIELPGGAEGLGSLAGVVGVTGPLAQPASLVVTDRLRFTAPARLPPAVVRLRADFAHEVTAPDGTKHTIDVSPASPDFIARADLPPLFVRTLLLGEDTAFFSHSGLALNELPQALATNWDRATAARGASTITQQLAKNLFLSREKTLERKVKELVLAFLLEAALGKDRILEIYVNVIEWGPGLYGLRPAARHYFGKEPGELSPKETAFLVALIPGPLKYQRSFAEGTLSPGFEPLVTNLLAKLRSVDALSEEDYAAALAEPLAFRRRELETP